MAFCVKFAWNIPVCRWSLMVTYFSLTLAGSSNLVTISSLACIPHLMEKGSLPKNLRFSNFTSTRHQKMHLRFSIFQTIWCSRYQNISVEGTKNHIFLGAYHFGSNNFLIFFKISKHRAIKNWAYFYKMKYFKNTN